MLKEQYEMLGFKFDRHRHGNGPFHYASENGSFVFEIYPLLKSKDKADHTMRLGFEMEDLASKVSALAQSNWKIVSGLSETEWGRIAIVQDLDGRKIELKSI